jgi:hypothetical protein
LSLKMACLLEFQGPEARSVAARIVVPRGVARNDAGASLRR